MTLPMKHTFLRTDVPHSIYECDGAKTCAIEMRSFSKNAGFTGTRLGFTIVPKELVDMQWNDRLTAFGQDAMEQNSTVRHTSFSVPAKQCTVKQERAQTKEQIAYYMNNAKEIRNALSGMGYTVFGGVNAPYIWLQTPDGMKSWDFFDYAVGESKCSRNTWFRIRTKWRRIFQTDCFWFS